MSSAHVATATGSSPWWDAWRRLRRNGAATVALILLAMLVFLSVLTPLWPLQSPYRVNSMRTLAPPEPLGIRAQGIDVLDVQGRPIESRIKAEFEDLNRFGHVVLRLRLSLWGERAVNSICGTDELGRDMLARLFWGSRVSLAAGFVAALVSLSIGVTYGAIAGYFGGRIDEMMMRVVDVLYSVPLIFLVIFLVTFIGEQPLKGWLEAYGINRMTVFFMLIGALYWLTMARVMRGQVISLKNEQFVEAAHMIGASRRRIIFAHLVPNLTSVIIVYLTLTIPQVMLFEAFLSFLGLGVQAPEVSWGVLANQGFKVITPVRTFWWLILYPGLALSMTLLALNVLGDGVRDALDPKLKNK